MHVECRKSYTTDDGRYEEVKDDGPHWFEVEDDLDFGGSDGGRYQCHTAEEAAKEYMDFRISLENEDGCIITCTNTITGEVERFEFYCKITCSKIT